MRLYEPIPVQYNAIQRPDPQDLWERRTYDLRGLKKPPAKPLDTASYGSQSLAGFTDVLAKPVKKPERKPAAPAAGPSAGPSQPDAKRAPPAPAAPAATKEAGAGSGKAAERPASAGVRPASGGARPAGAGVRPPTGGARPGSGGGIALEGAAAPRSQRGEGSVRPASARPGSAAKNDLERRMEGVRVSQAAPKGPRPPTPPVAGATKVRAAPPATMFRKLYDRGDLPLRIEHKGSFNALRWLLKDEAGNDLPLPQIDDDRFEQYAGLFIEGIREKGEPYRFIAVQGMLDLMDAAPDKFIPFLPKLVLPIKVALNTRDPEIISVALQLLKRLVALKGGAVGLAFVPFMRQILQIFNLFVNRSANLGDGMVYGQQRHHDIGLEVHETLAQFERYGGRDAYAHIKYMIPTYESVESK